MGVSSGKASREIEAPRYTIQDDVVSVTLALGIESYGPGLIQDLYMTVEVMPPGSNSHMEADRNHIDRARDVSWTKARGLDNKTSFVSNNQYRLAPATSVHPVYIDCSFVAPFTSDLSYTVTYGYQGSPVQTTRVTVDRDILVESWKLIVEGVSEPKHFVHVALGLAQLGTAYKGEAL